MNTTQYIPSMAAQMAATCPICLNIECHCNCPESELSLTELEHNSDASWLETEELL